MEFKVEAKTVTLEDEKAIKLYYKLHECLKISLTAPIQPNGDNLSCHANRIIVHLAKSIESGETWYDPSVDCWCDYFIESVEGKQRNTSFKCPAARTAQHC